MARVYFQKFENYPDWIKSKYGFKNKDIIAFIKIKHYYIASLMDLKTRMFEVSINSTVPSLDSITYQREFYSWAQKEMLKKDITRIMVKLKKDKDTEYFKNYVEKELYFNITWKNGKDINPDVKKYNKK